MDEKLLLASLQEEMETEEEKKSQLLFSKTNQSNTTITNHTGILSSVKITSGSASSVENSEGINSQQK